MKAAYLGIAMLKKWPIREASAKLAADIETTLRSAGNPIGSRDVLIAGTALAHRATRVTHNIHEFKRVKGRHFADWY